MVDMRREDLRTVRASNGMRKTWRNGMASVTLRLYDRLHRLRRLCRDPKFWAFVAAVVLVVAMPLGPLLAGSYEVELVISTHGEDHDDPQWNRSYVRFHLAGLPEGAELWLSFEAIVYGDANHTQPLASIEGNNLSFRHRDGESNQTYGRGFAHGSLAARAPVWILMNFTISTRCPSFGLVPAPSDCRAFVAIDEWADIEIPPEVQVTVWTERVPGHTGG